MHTESNRPQISVIVPAYNSERYIAKAIDSILAQEMQEMEVIAIDDGSTDQTASILDGYREKDPRVRVYHVGNCGVGEARNIALKLVRGKWLAFCDSDDEVAPHAYRKMIFIAEKEQADVVVGGFVELSEGFDRITLLPDRKNNFWDFYLVPSLWNKLIRTDFIRKNGLFFEPLKLGEDVVFLTQVYARVRQMAVCKELVYYYHKRITDISDAPSLTHRYDSSYFEEHIQCREKLLAICKENGVTEGEEYVFHHLTAFLLEFFYQTFDGQEKEKIFILLQQHLRQHNWQGEETRFSARFGTTPECFWRETARSYWHTHVSFDHRSQVLREFQTGQIGLRYTLRFGKAWLEYKLHRRKKRG